MRVLAVCLIVLCLYGSIVVCSVGSSQPNIIFLLTDDQDVTAHSLDYMPRLNKLMRQEGMEFLNCFVPTSLCCPSRATIIRGQYCHNTKVYDNGNLNNSTYVSGGFKKVTAEGLENSTIATQLKETGYETVLIGKYFNGYSDCDASHVPVGWDHWLGLTRTKYFGAHFSLQGEQLVTSDDIYQTDFISNEIQDFLKERDQSMPFFMYIATHAPHSPSTPAPRHKHLFQNEIAPRTPSYNPNDTIQQQKPSWIKRLPLLDTSQLDDIDELHRNRLRALQAVDEMLESIILLLQEEGIEDNTYVFYMSDNGEHLGDFRMPAGKRQAYDTDIRVPFLVRGPGIKGGTKVTEVVLSVDLLPTWVELGGGKLPTSYEVDGKSISPLLFGSTPAQPKVNTFRSVALAEMYGGTSNMDSRYEGMAGFEKHQFWNNTYQAVRVINGSDWAEDANWLYAEWCTGEKEFYNVTEDPYEINNIIDQVDTTLLAQLSVLTETMGKCAGKSCLDIDFKDISLLVEKNDGEKQQQLQCFNPHGMSGKSRHDSTWMRQGQRVDVDFCDLLANGFPYADNDYVPEPVLNLWLYCESCNKAITVIA